MFSWQSALGYTLIGFAATFASADSPNTRRLGVLHGTTLAYIDGNRVIRTPGDLRRVWTISAPKGLSRRNLKDPFTSFRVVDASSDGRLLITVRRLGDKEDGPLVVCDAATGGALRVFDIPGGGTTCAFLPPDDRRILIAWRQFERREPVTYQAIFDRETGEVERELPSGGPAVIRLAFTSKRDRWVTLHPASPIRESPRLWDSATWTSAEPLPFPDEAAYRLVDFQGDTLLLESWFTERWISCWSINRPDSLVDVVSDAANSAASHAYFLVNQGEKVIQWRAGGNDITLFGCRDAQSQTVALGEPLYGAAYNSETEEAVFASGRDIVFVDVKRAALKIRIEKVLAVPASEETSLFWVGQSQSPIQRPSTRRVGK